MLQIFVIKKNRKEMKDCTAEPINKMPLKSGKSGDDWTALQKTHVLFNTMFSFVILLLDRNKHDSFIYYYQI